jgi:hypothetical protein
LVPGRVKLERTWLERYLRLPAPVVTLDRCENALTGSRPLPLAYLHGGHPERYKHLPTVVGRYPLGPFLPRYARALQRGLGPDDDLGLEWAPPAPEPAHVLSIVNRAKHTTWQLDCPNGVDTPLLPVDEWRTYLLVVNNSAVPARIAYDKAATNGLMLGAGGGFHELTTGTTSALRGIGVGGTATLTVIEGRAWPAKACLLPCEEVIG